LGRHLHSRSDRRAYAPPLAGTVRGAARSSSKLHVAVPTLPTTAAAVASWQAASSVPPTARVTDTVFADELKPHLVELARGATRGEI
jgi:hypothetical protein